MPGFFNELESRYPTEFARLFEAFAEPWHEEAASAICRTLRRLSEERARAVGGQVYMQGIVETMVAELACSHAACEQARQAAGTRASTDLVEEVAATVERALDVGQIAERLGYPQQAAFAQAFKQETGLSPTAWRAERS